MNTTYMFDYPINWLILPFLNGDAKQRRLSAHGFNRGLKGGISVSHIARLAAVNLPCQAWTSYDEWLAYWL
jgi:hypothetical protein